MSGGRYRPKYTSNKSSNYSEHDDRDRTVHFSGSSSSSRGRGFGGRNKSRGRGFISKRGGSFKKQFRTRLGEDDIDMDGSGDQHGNSSGNSRFSPYNRGSSNRSRGRSSFYRGANGRGGSRPRLNNDQLQRMGLAAANDMGNRAFNLQDSDWYKITIPHGRKTEKDTLLKTVMENINAPLIPLQFNHDGQDAVFYVNDKNAATEIQSINKKITLATGYKMLTQVRASDPPVTNINPQSIEKLKVAMSNRYDPSSKVLALSEMYHDDVLKKDGLYFALGKFNVMAEVLKIIKEHIPELTGLKLNGNRLYNVNSLKTLGETAPALEMLDLGNNQLKYENDLDGIKNLKLTCLVLDGNPMCDRFKDNTTYISSMRKRFPKLVILDGHNLPPPITFDIEAPTALPPTQGSHFTDDQSKAIVCMFLQEYYKIYDSDDRQALLNAYHENALFSLSCSFNKVVVGKQPNFADYIQESRNILKVTESYKRHKMLKSGRLNVVALLSGLPKTQHDTFSSIVDVTHVSPQLMSFQVSGVFKERTSSGMHPPFRSFTRMFVTAPQASGVVIVNEELFITNATPEQVKKAFNTQTSLATAAAASTSAAAGSPAAATALGQPNPLVIAGTSNNFSVSTEPVSSEFLVQKQMIKQFSESSLMNEEWSKVCLLENNWDYQKAAQSFMDLQKIGKVPAEAYGK